MNRKLIAGAVAGLVAAVAIWFLFLRDRGDSPASQPTAARTADVPAAPTPQAPKADTPAEAPAGAAPRWSLDIDPAGTLQLEGQVLGPDGAGVGGAKVTLGSVPPRHTTSEQDGSFSFDKLVGRTYDLSAQTDALIGGTSYKLTSTSDPVVIRLTEGAAVDVTVQDEAGAPIASAEVANGERKATTGPDGKATIKPVRPGWVSIEASASGYAANSTFLTIGSGGATGSATITLKKGFAVSGTVVDEGGKPIAKAKVRVTNSAWWFGDVESASAISDDKGAFTITALAAGTHVLSAMDGEHAPSRSTPVTVKDRAVTGVTITMKEGGTYAGTVVTADGKPVPFATVRIAGKGADAWRAVPPRQATTDNAGAFELRGLARVPLQARAESDTAASKVTDVDLSTNATVRDAKLVLDVTGRITGTVVDETGAPVAEVQVNAFPDILGGANADSLVLAGMSSTSTDGGGAFVVTGLPTGSYRLWASRSNGNQGWGQQGVAAKTGDTNVKITLASEGALTGKIALSDGASPKIASVQVGMGPPTPVQNGEFLIKDLEPGEYDITLRGTDFVETVKVDVKVESNKKTDVGTLVVQRGRRVSGKVIDRNGPVAGAKVRLGEMLFTSEGSDEQMSQMESLYGVRSAVTDQAGEFSIVGVPTKALTAMADHPTRGRSIGVGVPAGTDDPPPLALQLKGFGSIAGKVTMKGKPQGRVQVSASLQGGGATAVFSETDDDGNFTISKVPEGQLVVQAMKSQMMTMKSTSVNAIVTAGRQTNVVIDIPVGDITLVVEVKAQPNQQVDAAQVFLFRGTVAVTHAKQLTEGFFQGGAQGMKFWLGKNLPFPDFTELVAGTYSACTIPITGDLSDPKFQGRLQASSEKLKVYCKQIALKESPKTQTLTQDVPAMVPLDAPE